MKRFPVLPCLVLFVFMMPGFMPIAHAQDVAEDEKLVVVGSGVEATLSAQTCDGNRVVLVTWKNTNESPAIAALTVKKRDAENFLLAVSIRLEPQAVEVESCGDIDVRARSLGDMSLNDFEAILVVPNN